MSAIIAGDSCNSCEKKFMMSLGHPKWFDNVVKRNQPKNKTYKLFEKICRSGMCLNCFLTLDEDEIDEL